MLPCFCCFDKLDELVKKYDLNCETQWKKNRTVIGRLYMHASINYYIGIEEGKKPSASLLNVYVVKSAIHTRPRNYGTQVFSSRYRKDSDNRSKTITAASQ
jgi:hypothetical protein